MNSTLELQPNSAIQLTRPVKARVFPHMKVPYTGEPYDCVFQVGSQLRLAWGHVPGDDPLTAFADDESAETVLIGVLDEMYDPAFVGYRLEIMAADLDGSYTILENKVFSAQEMDLQHSGHWRLIIRSIPNDLNWLDILPDSLRSEMALVREQLLSDQITFSEYLNCALDAFRTHLKGPQLRIEP